MFVLYHNESNLLKTNFFIIFLPKFVQDDFLPFCKFTRFSIFYY